MLLVVGVSAPAAAFSLAGTVWERAARAEGLDPHLLYSVALAESARSAGRGHVSPWPFALRGPDGPVYAPSADAARDLLNGRDDVNAFDLGWMQVNVGWNGWRARQIDDLLDPETNVRIGARILREALDSAPEDRVLGIGRYHSWTDERARQYGTRVAEIHQRLLDMADDAGGPAPKASALKAKRATAAGTNDWAVVPASVLARQQPGPDLRLLSDGVKLDPGMPLGMSPVTARAPKLRPIIFKPMKWPGNQADSRPAAKTANDGPDALWRIVGQDPLLAENAQDKNTPIRGFLCLRPNAAAACATYLRQARKEELAAAKSALRDPDSEGDQRGSKRTATR